MGSKESSECHGLPREIGNLLPNNRRQRRTCYALCHILYPVSAAHTSIFRMDSDSTSYMAGVLPIHIVKTVPEPSTLHSHTEPYLLTSELEPIGLSSYMMPAGQSGVRV